MKVIYTLCVLVALFAFPASGQQPRDDAGVSRALLNHLIASRAQEQGREVIIYPGYLDIDPASYSKVTGQQVSQVLRDMRKAVVEAPERFQGVALQGHPATVRLCDVFGQTPCAVARNQAREVYLGPIVALGGGRFQVLERLNDRTETGGPFSVSVRTYARVDGTWQVVESERKLAGRLVPIRN